LRAPMRANRIISTVALNPFLIDAQTNWASCYYRVSCGDWQGVQWGTGRRNGSSNLALPSCWKTTAEARRHGEQQISPPIFTDNTDSISPHYPEINCTRATDFTMARFPDPVFRLAFSDQCYPCSSVVRFWFFPITGFPLPLLPAQNPRCSLLPAGRKPALWPLFLPVCRPPAGGDKPFAADSRG